MSCRFEQRRDYGWGTLVLGALMLSGCAQGPSTGTTTPAGGNLEDYTLCSFEYPDHSPVNCDETDARPAETYVPTGWMCLSQAPPATVAHPQHLFRLWSNGQDRLGIEFRLTSPHEGTRYVNHLELNSSRGMEKFDFSSDSAGGFGLLGSAMPGTGSWKTRSFSFLAAGTPAPLDQDHLSLRVTQYGADPWFVWAFSNATDTVFFNRMVQQVVTMGAETVDDAWLPESFEVDGSDFHLSATAGKLVDASGSFHVPTATERPLWHSPCNA